MTLKRPAEALFKNPNGWFRWGTLKRPISSGGQLAVSFREDTYYTTPQHLKADNLPAERLEELNRALDEYILRCLAVEKRNGPWSFLEF